MTISGYTVTAAADTKIMVNSVSSWFVFFGHEKMDGGLYRCVCYSNKGVEKPSYERVCSIVEKYNVSEGTEYFISKEEYDANQANV